MFARGIDAKPVPIRKLLGVLVGGITVPLLVFAMGLLAFVSDAERRVIEAGRFDRTNNITLLVDGEISGMRLVAENLARSPEMQNENFMGLHEYAKKAVGGSVAIITVVSRSGQHVMSTAFVPSDPLPMSQNMTFLTKVFEGQSVVSDILIGTSSKRPVVALAVPVSINGEVKYALVAVVFPERFSAFFGMAGVDPNWTAAVVDQHGRFVVRNVDPEKMIGSLARPELGVAARGPASMGTFANVTLEGVSVESSFRRSSVTGWTTVVAVPKDEVYAAYYKSMLFAFIVASASALLVLLCVTVVARRIASEVRQMGEAATALVQGKAIEFSASSVLEFRELQAAYRHAEGLSEQKRHDEEHIRFLVKELFHRAKNLLAVVAAMSRATIRSAPSLEEYSKEFDGRLKSLAVSQDLLVEHPAHGGSLDALVHQQLAPFDSAAIQVSAECSSFRVHSDLVQPLGMAIYELATNSIKYGALSVASGMVEVSCKRSAGGMAICWHESGGPPVAFPSKQGFGTYVLRNYVAAVAQGSVDIQYEDGLRWSLFIPKSKLLEPVALHSDSASA